MVHLLYTANDSDGKPAKGFVEAGESHTAKEKLRQPGYQSVAFDQDVTS